MITSHATEAKTAHQAVLVPRKHSQHVRHTFLSANCMPNTKHPFFDHVGRRNPMAALICLDLTMRPCRIVCWAMFLCLRVGGGHHGGGGTQFSDFGRHGHVNSHASREVTENTSRLFGRRQRREESAGTDRQKI
jgi:hypothetical protein